MKQIAVLILVFCGIVSSTNKPVDKEGGRDNPGYTYETTDRSDKKSGFDTKMSMSESEKKHWSSDAEYQDDRNKFHKSKGPEDKSGLF